jgi:hypothetical protein
MKIPPLPKGGRGGINNKEVSMFEFTEVKALFYKAAWHLDKGHKKYKYSGEFLSNNDFSR